MPYKKSKKHLAAAAGLEYTSSCKRKTKPKENKKKGRALMMKNYMMTMVEKYFVKNLVVLGHVGEESNSGEMLKRNSYTLLNVSPRAF